MHEQSSYFVSLGNDGIPRAARAWTSSTVQFTIGGLVPAPGTPAGIAVAAVTSLDYMGPQGTGTLVLNGQSLTLMGYFANGLVVGRLPP